MAVESVKPSAPGSRLLIVDDESRLRDMLTRSATEMGFEPVAVRSAEQALKLLEADGGEVDVVLLDLGLPGMDGLELLELLRRRWPHAQVVILTGFGNLEAAKKAIRLDAVDFLTKPCSLEELELALAKARQRRLESFLPPIAESPAPDTSDLTPVAADVQTGSPITLEEAERVLILAALERHGGNRANAAAELGISERTLYYRLGRYQVREGRGNAP